MTRTELRYMTELMAWSRMFALSVVQFCPMEYSLSLFPRLSVVSFCEGGKLFILDWKWHFYWPEDFFLLFHRFSFDSTGWCRSEGWKTFSFSSDAQAAIDTFAILHEFQVMVGYDIIAVIQLWELLSYFKIHTKSLAAIRNNHHYFAVRLSLILFIATWHLEVSCGETTQNSTLTFSN